MYHPAAKQAPVNPSGELRAIDSELRALWLRLDAVPVEGGEVALALDGLDGVRELLASAAARLDTYYADLARQRSEAACVRRRAA